MKFYENLFVSSEYNKSKEDVLNEIHGVKILFHTYFVVLPVGDCVNQLEIMHAEMYKYLYDESEAYVIIGIALGYRNALELVREITEVVYLETGDALLGNYFKGKLEMETA